MKITPQEKKILREDGSYGYWDVVKDDIFLYEDHGCNHMMCVIESRLNNIKEIKKLYAFTYEQTSDEAFYDQDDCELIEVEEVPTITYRPKNNE